MTDNQCHFRLEPPSPVGWRHRGRVWRPGGLCWPPRANASSRCRQASETEPSCSRSLHNHEISHRQPPKQLLVSKNWHAYILFIDFYKRSCFQKRKGGWKKSLAAHTKVGLLFSPTFVWRIHERPVYFWQDAAVRRMLGRKTGKKFLFRSSADNNCIIMRALQDQISTSIQISWWLK